ncbi:unnamed protein product, partial [Symbiodinium microadriaticum]
EILAATRAALTSQYPACLAELSPAWEETPPAREYLCFFQFNLARDSDLSRSDGNRVRETLMGEVLHSIQRQHPRPKCIVLAPLKGFVPWLLEVRGHELLLTLGFDPSLASLMSRVLTAAGSAEELDLNLSFVDSDGDLVHFFCAVDDGFSQMRMRINSEASRRVRRLRSAGEDSLVVLLEDGSPLQVVAPRSSVEDGSLTRIQEVARGLGMLPVSMKKPLCTLCESFLASRKDGQCPDEEASFHFKHGAMLSSLHWWGDESAQGLRRSCGLLAGYLYEPGMMKQNAEDYAKGLLPFLPERQWHTSRAGSLGGRLAGLRPATEELIAELLRLVQEFGFVSPAPVFVDLGSGDGRVVIAVARRLGIRGVGVEMDPQLVRQSVDEVPESLRGLVQFVQGDLAMVDLPSADIVFLYLPQEATLKVLKDGFPALRGAARILVADPPGALQSNPARYGLRLLSSSAQQLPRLDVYEQLQ